MFAPDGRSLCIGRQRRIERLSCDDFSLQGEAKTDDDVLWLGFADSHSLLVLTRSRLSVWNAATLAWTSDLELPMPADRIFAIDVAQDGTMLAIGCEDRVHLFSLAP